jgi:HlyD family secretion protein
MVPKYTLPFLAAVGFLFAVYLVISGGKTAPVSQPVAEPAQAPFKTYIAGAGIIEARSDNIAIGASLPGVVDKVLVKVGDKVKAGEALFRLDQRELAAELEVRRSGEARARTGVAEAEAALTDVKALSDRAEVLADTQAISVELVDQRRNAVAIAKARVASARSQVASAQADIRVVETNLDRLIVRAPVNSEILQVNVRPGEYAATGVLAKPLVLLGDLERLHVRVDIDENDAWRFQPNSPAVAALRGNRDFRAKLSFVRVEPYVVPKRSLTGDSTERVDTRVLQAIYSFDRAELQAYVGQQVDVFIEAPGVAAEAPGPAAQKSGGGEPSKR